MNRTKKPYGWIEDKTCYISIVFTWQLPDVKAKVMQTDFWIDKYVVGGPALDLMPNFFDGIGHVSVSKNVNGILQKINPLATKTTIGCPRSCKFCGIGQGKIEGGKFMELDDWPDTPILIDNNLLASSQSHFDKVIDRLKRWGWCDFNQGLDVRLLSRYHANRISEIKKPMIRLALDDTKCKAFWVSAFRNLRDAGITLNNIRSYVLIGFDDDPATAWEKCNWVESYRIKALPMWFHRLDALKHNEITADQRALGWDDKKRREIMGFFYQHRGKRQ